MARFTDSQLNKLKTDISLVRLIQSQGYDLKQQGKEYIMCCPFHDDKTPSLKVSTQKNVFNCFGCDASGTVIDWVMKTQGISFRHACEVLADDADVTLTTHMPQKSTVQRLASPLTDDADNQKVLKQVIDYYQDSLKQSPEALAYLQKRGLTNAELIDTFKLGFANRTLGLRLPAKAWVAGKKIRSQLQDIGIYRKSGHEHFNGSIVVPVISETGQILEVYGRKIVRNLRKGTPKHLYLPGAHAGVFNSVCLKASKEVVLCESLIDALTFYNHGFRNVTSSYGTAGFTDDILQAFKANNIKRVLIAYDRDKAGNDAAGELSKKLNKQGMDTFRILFPKNMDANEYALSVQPAVKSLAIVIRKAQWMGNADGLTLKGSNSKVADTAGAGMHLDEKVPEVNNEQEIHKKQRAVKEKKLFSLASPELLPEPVASVIPEAGSPTNAIISDHEVNISFGQSPDKIRKYRIRGLSKNMSYEQLKLNIHVIKGERYYIDTFDLYHARARTTYIKQASIELGHDIKVIKKDLGLILIKLEELQEAQIKQALNVDEKKAPTLSESEYTSAMELLKSPDLLERITADLTASGIIGEDVNKLTGYLACVSRKLDRPLAIIIQSTSAAGKSSLMDAILNLMPDEELTQYSAMTGQSLFYMGETNLKNKILAIAEEEGAQNASYALKPLQSEGQLTIASTGKDDTSGNMVTKEYHVQGPVMLFMTTTAIDIDEELMNRCLVLTVNESREQTLAIHNIQRHLHTIDGILAKESKKHIIDLHKNMQRLIKPMLVANPYAQELTFINDKTRTRRDHMKYLTLINSITLLHQHQRKIKTVNHNGEVLQYIEVEKSDIATANKLAHEILGRSLDELPPQTRTLLRLIHGMVKKNCEDEDMAQSDYRFSRRDIREYCSWSDFQVKKHVTRLQDMEYLLIHRGGRGQSFVYELLYQNEGKDGSHFMLGLKNYDYDNNKEPLKANKEPSSSPQVAPKVPLSCTSEKPLKANDSKALDNINGKIPKNARSRVENNNSRTLN